MISLEDYFGKWWGHADVTDSRIENAESLLDACADLEAIARMDGVEFPINPNTGTQVSGSEFGGFRPQSCRVGVPSSAHKEAEAVDRYDPTGDIDKWCMKNLSKLEACGIYIEHPSATEGWSHWSIRRPKSGNRVFYP